MPIESGEAFAGYRIVRMLGSGGMGDVYLAQHPRLPRQDALKVLKPDVCTGPNVRGRFIREADLAATLSHPNIIGVYDRGEYLGRLWISMEFADGVDAGELIRQRYPGGMPAREVAEIVTAVAAGLDYAHKRGLLHRDVKPANIMVAHLDDAEERRIMLTDFGIARAVDDISGLTTTNMAMGTAAYCAPEQLLGEDIDGRADQYALAATAYHLLTGSQLFANSNPAVVISHHLNVAPPAVGDIRPELAMLDPVLARGLAKQPEDRFKRCSDFARAFTAQIAPAQRSPRRTLSRSALAAIVVLASIGALVFLLRPSPHGRAANSATITPAIAPATTTTASAAATTTASAAATTKTTAAAAPKTTATTAALTNPPDATFERMRDFVTSYYADLPARPMDAWAKLDANYQNKNGRSDYLGFWATIQSVTVVSVVPRDATSVVAELRYVLLDGTFSTERRWLQVVLMNGAMLIDDSGHV